LYIATGKSGKLCRPWRIVLYTYIRLLYYCVLLLFCVSQGHLKENCVSLHSTFKVWLWGC
jgi:hypothetical protein